MSKESAVESSGGPQRQTLPTLCCQTPELFDRFAKLHLCHWHGFNSRGSSIDHTLLIPSVKSRQSTGVCLLPTSVLFLLCSGVCVCVFVGVCASRGLVFRHQTFREAMLALPTVGLDEFSFFNVQRVSSGLAAS